MKARFIGFLSALMITGGLMLPTQAFSQAQAKPDTSHFFTVDTLKARLGLTDEQTEKIRFIVKAGKEQVTKDYKLYKGYSQTMREAMLASHEKMTKEILALLTDEQKKKFEQFQKERAALKKDKRKKKMPKSTP